MKCADAAGIYHVLEEPPPPRMCRNASKRSRLFPQTFPFPLFPAKYANAVEEIGSVAASGRFKMEQGSFPRAGLESGGGGGGAQMLKMLRNSETPQLHPLA